jgi:dephospho-CoA kinase
MMIVGLTGSMAMGKSTAASYLKSHGVPVFDSDSAVHALYEGEAVADIAQGFPGVADGGRVDRKKLGEAVAGDPRALARLEAIVHPMVRRKQRDFILAEASRGVEVVVLDIPLLFESGADKLCDAVIVVSAPQELQRQRLSSRKGMTPERIKDLLARQMPDAEKRDRADFVVDTSGPISQSRAQLDRILATLRQREGERIDVWRDMKV